MNIGIVRAKFNEEYTHEMLEAAKEQANKRRLEVVEILEVPGAHEIPVATAKLLEHDEIDGVAVLGAVIKGATDHDEVICQNVSKQLLELQCEHGKPVGFGVIGPNVSWSQVETRTEKYAHGAVNAVADTVEELRINEG